MIKHNQAANLAYGITQYGLLVGFIHPLFVFFPHLQKFFFNDCFFSRKRWNFKTRLPDMNQERKAKVKHRKTIMAFQKYEKFFFTMTVQTVGHHCWDIYFIPFLLNAYLTLDFNLKVK